MILQPMHQPAPVRRQREAPGKWFLYGEQHLPPGGSEIVKLHSSGPPLVLSGNKIDPLLCRHNSCFWPRSASRWSASSAKILSERRPTPDLLPCLVQAHPSMRICSNFKPL